MEKYAVGTVVVDSAMCDERWASRAVVRVGRCAVERSAEGCTLRRLDSAPREKPCSVALEMGTHDGLLSPHGWS